MNSAKGYLLILTAVTFWAISATIARFLFSHQVDPLILVQTRMSFSCLLLLLFFLIFRRPLLRIRPADLWRLAMLGILGNAGSNFFYYLAIQETNVATAILLQYLAPVFVLVYAAITGDERVSLAKVVAGCVSLVGCFLAVTGSELSILHINRSGLLAGIGAALSWAFTNVWLRRLIKDYSSWTLLVYAFIFGSTFWLFVNTPMDIVRANYPLNTWGLFFGFAIISILIPHSLYYMGMRYLTASRAIITATFEPVVAIATAYVFLNEPFSLVQAGGGLLVISAIVTLQLWQESPPPAYETVVTRQGE